MKQGARVQKRDITKLTQNRFAENKHNIKTLVATTLYHQKFLKTLFRIYSHNLPLPKKSLKVLFHSKEF